MSARLRLECEDVRGSDINWNNRRYFVSRDIGMAEVGQSGMGSPQRTHLLPFTRCDRGMTQQIPFYQSLAPSHLEIPDSIIVLPRFCLPFLSLLYFAVSLMYFSVPCDMFCYLTL